MMLYKKGKSLTNAWTYIGLIFIIVVFLLTMQFAGRELLLSNEANLDADSVNYSATLNGIDLSEYQATQEEIEDPIAFNVNTSSGNPKDYALDFLYAKEKSIPITTKIKNIFDFPKIILYTVFRFDVNSWGWLVNIIGWLFAIGILITIVYYIRGLLDK